MSFITVLEIWYSFSSRYIVHVIVQASKPCLCSIEYVSTFHFGRIYFLRNTLSQVRSEYGFAEVKNFEIETTCTPEQVTVYMTLWNR